MSDMISRQKLIEELEAAREPHKQIADSDISDRTRLHAIGIVGAYNYAIELANTQPPADLPWIPVSSGILPETGQQIFATCEQEGESDVMEIYYNSELLVPPWRMTAWMPAEPYKEAK